MLKSIDTCVPHLSSKEDRKLVVQRDTLGGLGVSSGWHPTTLAWRGSPRCRSCPPCTKTPHRSCQNLLHLGIEDALVVGDERKQEGENGHALPPLSIQSTSNIGRVGQLVIDSRELVLVSPSSSIVSMAAMCQQCTKAHRWPWGSWFWSHPRSPQGAWQSWAARHWTTRELVLVSPSSSPVSMASPPATYNTVSCKV